MKKYLIIISILLIISYTTGVFVEITIPHHMNLTPEIPSFSISLWRTVKNDFSTLFLAVFFSLTGWLFPFTAMLFAAKSFALGFSSAFLFSFPDTKAAILLSALIPRIVLKLPAYILLLYMSFELAKYTISLSSKHKAKEGALTYISLRIALGMFLLLISSLTEAVLTQIML